MLSLSRTHIIIIVALILGMLASYILFAFRAYLIGPSLTVFEPQTGVAVSDALVTVRGKTSNVALLELNDRIVATDESGNFAEQLLLSYGYNIISLEALDRFGRSKEERIELIYK